MRGPKGFSGPLHSKDLIPRELMVGLKTSMPGFWSQQSLPYVLWNTPEAKHSNTNILNAQRPVLPPPPPSPRIAQSAHKILLQRTTSMSHIGELAPMALCDIHVAGSPTVEACRSMPQHLILGPVGRGFEACRSMPQHAVAH